MRAGSGYELAEEVAGTERLALAVSAPKLVALDTAFGNGINCQTTRALPRHGSLWDPMASMVKVANSDMT